MFRTLRRPFLSTACVAFAVLLAAASTAGASLRPSNFDVSDSMSQAVRAAAGAATTAGDAASAEVDPDTSSYQAFVPVRVADTREEGGYTRVDANTIRIPVVGHGIATSTGPGVIAADTVAVVASITLVANDGFAVAYRTGGPAPATSNVNANPGSFAHTATTIVSVGHGSIDVRTSRTGAHVIVDLTGSFRPATSAAAGRFQPVGPVRVLDTRQDASAAVAGGVLNVNMLPAIPVDAVAVALNVTAVAARQGFATMYPTGTVRPTVSQLSVGTGQTQAAATIVAAEAGRVNIFTSFTGDVVVDVTGYFTGPDSGTSTDGLYVAYETPQRRLDTRPGMFLHGGGGIEVAMTQPGAAFVGTLTATQARGDTFLTAWPAGTSAQESSSLNATPASGAVSNFLLGGASTRGIAITSPVTTHAIVDQTGYFTGTPQAATLPVPANVAAAPPAPPTYPTGMCDTITTGAEPLALTGATPTATRQIGTSVQGRPIWAEYWGPLDATSVAVVVAQIHGNECSVNRLTRAVRQQPPTSYGIWLIPTINPDGYAAGMRRNANNVDLNADGGNASQPETRALLEFTAAIAPNVTVHAHSPNGFIGWYGSGPARRIAETIGAASAIRVSGAGARADFNRWFLWQGQQPAGSHPTVLVEFFAIAASEVPTARPRPPHRSIADADMLANATLAALDDALGR